MFLFIFPNVYYIMRPWSAQTFAYNAVADEVCNTDIIFVLDRSGSVGETNFDLMKNFVNDLVALFQIDEGNTRVGVVVYSWFVTDFFLLNQYSTSADIQSRISSFTWQSYGTTATDEGLYKVRSEMLLPTAGDRADAPNVVVVITDGYSDNATATAVSIGL